MTLQSNPFKCVLPLQHMAKVKTVETLWRSSSRRAELKTPCTEEEWQDLVSLKKPMIELLDKFVNGLPLPQVLKKDLKIYVMHMVDDAVEWLNCDLNDPSDEEYEMFAHCYEQFYWDNNGFVDGRKILNSYVANKDEITVPAWNLLCDYCIKEDIIRLSPTMNSSRVKKFIKSPFSIYWHWRIHGKFPTKEKYVDEEEYDDYRNLYNANSIVRELLSITMAHSDGPRSVSAIKHLRRQDEVEFQKLNRLMDVYTCPARNCFYLFQQMDLKTLIKQIENISLIAHYSLQWPWPMFIADWMKMVEGMSLPQFMEVFHSRSLCRGRTLQAWMDLDEKHCEILREGYTYPLARQLRTRFISLFGFNVELIRDIFWATFLQGEPDLCEIMLEGFDSSQRRFLLGSLPDYDGHQEVRNWLDSEVIFFCNEFIGRVLNSEEERKTFQDMITNIRQAT